MRLIEVDWKQSVLKAGWHISSSGTARAFLFSKWNFRRVPRNPREDKAKERLDQLVSPTGFLRWWDRTCGGEDPVDKLLLLRFPGGAWDIPWELLIEDLEEPKMRATVCLARNPGTELPIAPSLFDEPLRHLILQGDDGESIDQKVDLQALIQPVELAWGSLEMGSRECVVKPRVERVTSTNLPSLLFDYKPHMLWFFGHGRAKPSVSLLLADQRWVGAADFADLIQQSGQIPLYAVFCACDTGRSDEMHGAMPGLPTLFKELARVGVMTVLAMQSPIRDVSARVLAKDLFRFLAAGFPLEIALARARANMLDGLPEGAHRFDWASPVVWSTGQAVEHLSWNSQAQHYAQLQLIGRQAMRSQLDRPHELDSESASDELLRASVWASLPRVWVHHSIQSHEYQHRWVRTLQAIQSQTKRFIVAVEIRDAQDPATSLQDWAQGVYHRALPQDFTDDIAEILSEIARSPTSGWNKLCKLQGIYLAIANPPTYRESNWFWDPLLSLSVEDSLQVAILSVQQLSVDIQNDWDLDQVGVEMDEQILALAIDHAPQLARALAVLDLPLGISYIEESGWALREWPERTSVLIETSAGPIMAATARQRILSEMNQEQLRLAHLDCAKMLGHPTLPLTTQVRERRLNHLLGAGLTPHALEEATILCRRYREEDRPFAVIDVVKRLGPLGLDLPSSARLCAAWAYLQSSQLAQAKYWLQRSAPVSALDIAWKHGIQAEIFKSEGAKHSKEAALAEIDAAIEVCRSAIGDPALPTYLVRKRLRAYRQDRARILQYLFYEREQAATEYGKLVEEWQDQPEAAIDLAVVKRNYAECLRTLATDPDDPRWRRAHDLLHEAEQLARDYPQAPVLSEVLYEKARAAEASRNLSEARECLLECQKAARQSRHYMMLVIAKSCYFWMYEPFVWDRWEEIEADLKVFPHHGWAIRVLIDGRLRVARYLEKNQDLLGGFGQLEANLGDLERNPSFDQGSDRRRIAVTMAGLQVIGGKMGHPVSYWSDFRSDYPWSEDWLQGQTASSAEAVWSEVQ